MTPDIDAIAMRVAKETCCELWGIEDIAFAPSKDMEDFVKTFARRLVAELQKGQEPVAYVRYEVGVRPTFVPVIAGKCEVSQPKLHEFNPLFAAPVTTAEDAVEQARRTT